MPLQVRQRQLVTIICCQREAAAARPAALERRLDETVRHLSLAEPVPQVRVRTPRPNKKGEDRRSVSPLCELPSRAASRKVRSSYLAAVNRSTTDRTCVTLDPVAALSALSA